MGRKYRGKITINVDMDDVLNELSDDDVKGEFKERFGTRSESIVAFDLLDEIRAELIGGRTNAALALVESEIEARRVPEERRQAEYQRAMHPSAAH